MAANDFAAPLFWRLHCFAVVHPFLYGYDFGNGQMENIPIGIVDQDNTATSRAIARNISAVPTFKVTKHFADEAAARESVQKKEIYGYLSIPPQFEQDAITGKMQHSPTIITMHYCR